MCISCNVHVVHVHACACACDMCMCICVHVDCCAQSHVYTVIGVCTRNKARTGARRCEILYGTALFKNSTHPAVGSHGSPNHPLSLSPHTHTRSLAELWHSPQPPHTRSSQPRPCRVCGVWCVPFSLRGTASWFIQKVHCIGVAPTVP